MGTTYRFIADPHEPSEVLAWFRALSVPPTEVEKERGVLLLFGEPGSLAYDASGAIDAKASPLVSIFSPRVRRGILWTVGEVHFLSTPVRKRFPALHRVSSAFSDWLSTRHCGYSDQNDEFGYYLEGSIKNFDSAVFAFESGLRALRAGRYFVADDDTEFLLDQLCQKLRLRGVECSEA
jgi:hypothetical protein